MCLGVACHKLDIGIVSARQCHENSVEMRVTMIFQLMGIMILLVFYGCYFLKMINQKKKGIQTNQMGKGKAGFVKFIEVTLKIISILVPIVEVVSIAANTTYFPDWVRVIGMCIGTIGVAVLFCLFSQCGTVGEPVFLRRKKQSL